MIRPGKAGLGNPWWVAKEVLDILGLDRTATRRLDEDEKNTLRLTHGNKTRGNPYKNRGQRTRTLFPDPAVTQTTGQMHCYVLKKKRQVSQI